MTTHTVEQHFAKAEPAVLATYLKPVSYTHLTLPTIYSV